MLSLDTDRGRASFLLMALGIALVLALVPFATGLIAIPVLYVILRPAYQGLSKHLGLRLSAGLTTALAVLLLIIPTALFATLVLAEASDIAAALTDGPLLDRIREMRIGRIDVGAQLASLSTAAMNWLGGSALGLIGSATKQALNLIIALFGLYHLLLRPGEVWTAFSRWLPFSDRTIERLQTRFRDVTASTVIGTGLVALFQGLLLGLGLWVAGVPNALFWSLITVMLSILPVVGSALVFGPAAIWLITEQRPAAGIALFLWGALIVGNMDFFVRPLVGKRWGHIHPITTLVGALAGVPYFGLLGLLIGPLAVSYFFELLNAYRTEYAPNAESTPQASKGTLIS